MKARPVAAAGAPVPAGARPADDDGIGVPLPQTDVFIIDDDRPLAEVFHQVLERRGLSVRTFHGRADLEAVARDQWAALMVLDLSLGESDAVEIIQMLARRNYSGAIALMSGRGEGPLNQVHTIGMRHGLTMLTPLSKPIRRDQIEMIVRYVTALERHAPRYDLRNALEADWVEFWYQPKYDLKTATVVGMEALARVRHPTDGILSPADFMPNQPGAALDQLTEMAVVTACRDWTRLAAGGTNVRMSVNASISSLLNGDLIPIIRAARPADPAWPGLIVEITETELIRDLDLAFELAVRLGLYDVDISIDDFGTGHSSLSRLRALPFAEIKIDRSFVNGVGGDPKRAAICEMTVGLARRFGRTAVAEGIESTADLAALTAMGCDIGQGFLFSRPRPIEEYCRPAGEPAAKTGN